MDEWGGGVYTNKSLFKNWVYYIKPVLSNQKKWITQHFEQCEETLMSHRYNYMALDI